MRSYVNYEAMPNVRYRMIIIKKVIYSRLTSITILRLIYVIKNQKKGCQILLKDYALIYVLM